MVEICSELNLVLGLSKEFIEIGHKTIKNIVLHVIESEISQAFKITFTLKQYTSEICTLRGFVI
jgi:hypothetical protein